MIDKEIDINKEMDMIGSLFSSAKGKAVLAVLSRDFYDVPEYVQGDTHHSAFRGGQRDVVGYLKECAEREVD